MASKFALVIANTEYQDASFAKLTAPGKDAEEFAQVLRELATFDDVQVLLNEGEGRTRRAIARFFANRKRDELLLLYFSGHGVRNEQGHLFLAANDTEINILEASGIPAEFVTQSMNTSRSQRQLLILDCCNSGAFAHGSKSATGVGKSMGIATAFEGSGFGRVVLTATDATQYAWEGDKVIGDTQKSVFTHFLIEGLKGEADRDGDGRIHVDELYDYAYEQVVTHTPKQTPGKWSYRQQGDIILRENLKPRDVKPIALPDELLELLSHPNSGIRRAGIQELIGLLSSKHLGLARAVQEKLREIVESGDSLTIRTTARDALVSHGLVLEKDAPPRFSGESAKENLIPLLKTSALQTSAQKQMAGIETMPRVTPDSKSTTSKLNLRLTSAIIGGLLLVALVIWEVSNLTNNLFMSPPKPTFTSQPATTQTIQSIETSTTSPTNANTSSSTQPSISSTPTYDIGSIMISDKDNMTLMYVPAGEFTMGSDTNSDEQPVHQVYLESFWIDQTEVTVGMYILCVEMGVCNEPVYKSSFNRSSYYGNSRFDNYPVIFVDWDRAKTYCEWAERRLPTEAEWEKAARGTDGRTYPWGENIDCSLTNYWGSGNYNCVGDTNEVGKYPSGASTYGVLDMAGNVSEWVSDFYSDTYYQNSPLSNPLGPDSGEYRSLRGGSWLFGGGDVRSADRFVNDPTRSNSYFGFRCAMDATP